MIERVHVNDAVAHPGDEAPAFARVPLRLQVLVEVIDVIGLVAPQLTLDAEGIKMCIRDSYSATNPVAGVTYRATSMLNLYASYGRGFETPTLNDLAYRSTDGSIPGLNLGLEPARSDNFEVGMKAEASHVRASVDAFYIKTHDELAVAANAAGRSVYENIDETQRRGAELGLDAWWSGGFSARLAYTYIRATVVSPYSTCITCLLYTSPRRPRFFRAPTRATPTSTPFTAVCRPTSCLLYTSRCV